MAKYNIDLLNTFVYDDKYQLFNLEENGEEINFTLAYFCKYNKEEIDSLVEEFINDYLDAYSSYTCIKSHFYDNLINVYIDGVYIDRAHRNYL